MLPGWACKGTESFNLKIAISCGSWLLNLTGCQTSTVVSKDVPDAIIGKSHSIMSVGFSGDFTSNLKIH